MTEYITYTTATADQQKIYEPQTRFESLLLKSPSLMRCKTFFSRRKKTSVPSLDRSDSLTTVNTNSTIKTPPRSPMLAAKSMDDYSDEENETTEIPYSANGYSIFYLKMPNGKWLLRVRTADRKIIATYEVDGCMI
ncbi:hypothetical protein DFQ28_007224 [Apophysomyces sp. BC1034]|nr:hypothetical protein DFQ30_006537 [Apophysomyces sp. BC1015]KAG0176515.1 hypothetical protein DFQ29_006005 [Apophysomyces sp. BC1021]KAG0186843.1 hypothetical protein DFQ28_007224 [Apophysomyces sp. BC1034]